MIIGKHIIEFEEIDSTSDEARRRASEVEEGTLFLAKKQSRGKGKPGAEWFSPEGGLYFSFILRPHKEPRELVEVTQAFARAVVSSLRNFSGIQAEVKQPNDVLVKGKKICGILTERIVQNGKASIIAGIGVNLNILELPSALKATSIKIETGSDIDIKAFLQVLLEELNKEYSNFIKGSV